MGSVDRFAESGTLGIEEEYYVVDAAGRPTSGTDVLVHESTPPEPLADRLDHELFKCVIEAQTPTLSGVDEVEEGLRRIRRALLDHAADHGYGIAAAGLHPGARWRELEHAEKPRYRRQLERIQYPQHRNTTAGLHVHVGVPDADLAVWVANELRWYLPIALALSANSPYWNGHDTGLASARAKIFEGLPNTGVPGAFPDFAAFADLEATLLETESITDRGEVWWDVRPHTGLGTVEVRVPDAQAAPWRVLALVEYVHALVTERIAAFEAADAPWRPYRETGAAAPAPGDPLAGEVVGDVRREILVENKWRALRYGHDASFLRPDGAGVVSLATAVEREAARLDVPALADLHAAESGTAAQRRHHAEGGAAALYESLRLEA
ncbi:MAG: glutamate--cysteine ligase [Halobacteriaceae archaeon]